MSVTDEIKSGGKSELGRVLQFRRPEQPRGHRQFQEVNSTEFVVVNLLPSSGEWTLNTLLAAERPAQAIPPSKSYLYNYLAEMGFMYHHAHENEVSSRDLSSLERNRILLVRMMNGGDPMERALAAIVICQLVEIYEVDREKHIVSTANELNQLMSRLPIEVPASIIADSHEIEQLPAVSEDAIYEPRSRHPAELAARVLDKAFAAIYAMDSPDAAMVSETYGKAAKDLTLLALIEYGKLLGRVSQDQPEREEIYQAAGINFRGAKKQGITRGIRTYAGEMCELYPAPSTTFTGLLSSVAHRIGLGSFLKV